MAEERDEEIIDAVEEEEVAPEPEMDKPTALKEVLKKALIHDGLARGLRECAKALDRRQAHLCVLAGECDEPAYVKLVNALCMAHNIPLMKVDSAKELVRADTPPASKQSSPCSLVSFSTASSCLACACGKY